MNSRRWGVLRAILEAGYHRTKLRKNLECVAAAWIYGEQWSPPTTPSAHQRGLAKGKTLGHESSRAIQLYTLLKVRCIRKHGSISGGLTSSAWDAGCWFLLANTFLLLALPLMRERAGGAQSPRREWPHDLRKMIREQHTSMPSEISYHC